MLIFGDKNNIDRLYQLRDTYADLDRILKNEHKIVSDVSQLDEVLHEDTPILVLDLMNASVMKLLYRKKHVHTAAPVCDRIVFMDDAHADEIINGRLNSLEGANNWTWHRSANRFRMFRGFINRSSVTDHLPSHIQLEHTSFCNAKCIMCVHALKGNEGAAHISDELLQRMKSLLPTCELMVLHGYGEPLLTKNLGEILELYHSYGIEVTTNTNLSYLPDDILRPLAKTTNHLRISCDGVTPEIYEKIRPGLRFSEFVNNVDRLRKASAGMELLMETVIMRQNIHQLPEMVRFAHDHGFSQISFNRLGSHPLLNNDVDCLDRYPETTSWYLHKAVELGNQLGVRVIFPVEWLSFEHDAGRLKEEQLQMNSYPFVMQPLDFNIHENLIRSGHVLLPDDSELAAGKYCCEGMCDSLLGRTNIDLSGNVYTCCINVLKQTGNLLEQDDTEFYNSPALIKMRDMFYKGEIPEYCSNCSYVMNRTLAFAQVGERE